MAIPRYDLVTRHNPVLREPHFQSPLSVGNGELAFTADVTGMQSFPEAYEGDTTTPLCTMSQRGWHSFAPPSGEPLRPHLWPSQQGRSIPYYTHKHDQEPIYRWLRENPHRLHLGRLGLSMRLADGSRASLADMRDIHQELNLWEGMLSSRFTVEGVPVYVETCCHPRQDTLGFAIQSPLIQAGRLHVEAVFPYGSPAKSAAAWDNPQGHTSRVATSEAGRWLIQRSLDADQYFLTYSPWLKPGDSGIAQN